MTDNKVVEEALKNNVLRHRIRLWAHGLDFRMQFRPDDLIPAKGGSWEPLKRLEDALELWRSAFGTAKPDIIWAEQIAKKCRSFMENGSCSWDPPAQALSSSDIALLDNIIRNRRSVRDWKEDPVPQELLNKVLEAGLWAPSGSNAQPIRYCIIDTPETKEFISSVTGTRFLNKAPVIIVVGSDTRGIGEVAHSDGSNLNTGAAVQNMLLMASSLGLGTCWLYKTALKSDDFIKRFNVPAYMKLTALVALGWPKYTPAAPGRMCVDEVSFLERFEMEDGLK